jgi:membrane-associated phospholipid phosphatase
MRATREPVPESGWAWEWALELWLLLAAATVTLMLTEGVLLDVDLAVRDWVTANQVRPLHLLARGLNFGGSASVLAAVALALAAATVVRARTWPAAIAVLRPVVLALGLSYLVIGPVKLWTDRAAPRNPSWDAVLLFAHPEGWSFPSGHVVNAVVWYGVLAYLIDALLRCLGRAPLADRDRRRLRCWPPVVISVTVTYLNYHWLTDTITALLLGVLLDRLLRRLDKPWPPPPAHYRGVRPRTAAGGDRSSTPESTAKPDSRECGRREP